jgi:hypothetical protein
MSEALKGPFSHIVRYEGTEIITVTSDPDLEGELIATKSDFKNRFHATDVDYEHGIAIKDPPDGKAINVVIWHAKWSHGEKYPRPPLIEIPFKQ